MDGQTAPHDQSWYWTQHWQDAEREVDEWKDRPERVGPMPIGEALTVLDQLMGSENG